MRLIMDGAVISDRFGDYEAISLAKAAGFDGIDYSFYALTEDRPMRGENYIEYAKSVRRCLDEQGLVCRQAHAPFSFGYGEKMDESEPHYRDVVRAIEASAILGVENIIVHSIPVPPNTDYEAYNLSYYKSLEPYCEKYGVHIAVENLFRYNANCRSYLGMLHTPQLLCDFIQKLDSPWFVACLDVGHAAITGMEPEDYIAGMKGGLLKALHIQDTDYLGDTHTLPYLGRLNWDAVMSELKKINYDGDFTFEVMGFMGKHPKELLPDALKYAAAIGRHLIAKFESGSC